MKILLINKTSFEVIQINNVTNIAFSDGSVVITAGSASTYSLETYNIQFLW